MNTSKQLFDAARRLGELKAREANETVRNTLADSESRMLIDAVTRREYEIECAKHGVTPQVRG